MAWWRASRARVTRLSGRRPYPLNGGRPFEAESKGAAILEAHRLFPEVRVELLHVEEVTGPEGFAPAKGGPFDPGERGAPARKPASSAPRGPTRDGGAVEATAKRHAADIARLVPLARELLEGRQAYGVTVSDLRYQAAKRGLLANDAGRSSGKQRALSWLGAVMKAAGAVATDRMRRSEIPHSHGNAQRVWVSPEFSTSPQPPGPVPALPGDTTSAA